MFTARHGQLPSTWVFPVSPNPFLLHASLTGRTNGRSLGTFQKAMLFRKLESLDSNVLSHPLQATRDAMLTRPTSGLPVKHIHITLRWQTTDWGLFRRPCHWNCARITRGLCPQCAVSTTLSAILSPTPTTAATVKSIQ